MAALVKGSSLDVFDKILSLFLGKNERDGALQAAEGIQAWQSNHVLER